MKILITNDDGIFAEGIKILAQKLMLLNAEILVVAPKYEMSATSHKLTIREPFFAGKTEDIIDGITSYMVEGTPADCVKFAINGLDYIPDIIFSGVNKGYNIGNDIAYSGTVSAACEGSFYNIKSIAVSCSKDSFAGMDYFNEVIDYLFDSNIYKDAKIININIPEKPVGIKITRQGIFPFVTKYVKEDDGLYHIKTKSIGFEIENDADTDVFAIKNNYVSISPLTVDKTDILTFKKLKK